MDMEDVETSRDWANLPSDILPQIFNRLDIIELLAFRGVCKSWRLTYFNRSPENQPKAQHPWILFYCGTDGKKCFLYNEPSRRYYTSDIPELQNSLCIGSNYGWLLIHRDGLLFFFNPFSRMKVDLPEIKHTMISAHMAAFTSPPTSEDCTVFLVSWSDQETIELNICRRGDNEWTNTSSSISHHKLGDIIGAIFSEGEFCYFDKDAGLGTYRVHDKEFSIYKIVKHGSGQPLHFYIWKNHFRDKVLNKFNYSNDGLKMKDLLTNFEGKRFSISVCGTSVPHQSKEACIAHEIVDYSVEGADDESEQQCIRAVWIDPRFIEPPPNYRWSP